MMRRLLGLCGFIILMNSLTVSGQYYYHNSRYYETDFNMEIGVSGGLMNALTDLGGKKGIGKNFIKDLRWKPARPCYGIYLMGNYKYALGIRLEGTVGKVTGYDSILRNVASSTAGRYERNLSFRSKISELQLAFEVHPLFFKTYDVNEAPRLSPYALIGAGYYTFDPEARLNDEWYALQPLHLEGQGFAEYPERRNYKLAQFNLLGGLGLRYEVNDFLNARIELVHRKLFTDYLDDVSTTYIDPALFAKYLSPSQSAIARQLFFRRYEINASDVQPTPGEQRGNPKNNDAYFTIQAKIGFTIGVRRR